MAEFGDNFEVDPAAEFLAREQDELAGLEDEVKPAAISAPVVNGGDGAGSLSKNENSMSSFEMIDPMDQETFDAPPKEPSQLASDAQFGLGHDYERQSLTPSPTPSKNEVREEPEKIKKWREEQITRLEEKDKEEEKKKEEWRVIAKKELEDWYKNHEEQIAKTKAANRNAEKQFVADDNEIEPGTEWERISKLCDFNQKAKQGSKDVSRMRSIILQLKSPNQLKNAA